MEHPDHSESARTYLDNLYATDKRYVACKAQDSESFRQWQEQARPLLQHLLGLESIGTALGDHTIHVEWGNNDHGDSN